MDANVSLSPYYPQHDMKISVEFGSELYSAYLIYLGLVGDKKLLFNC